MRFASIARPRACQHGGMRDVAVRAGVAVALALLALGSAVGTAPADAAPRRPPNIIVVQTDDQNANELTHRSMPDTYRLMVKGGISFQHYVVVTPQCCPSRTALLTGQYPHNNGVLANSPGYPALVHKHSVLPAWLEAAGYRTAHVGKYLNHYETASGGIDVPAPGWDQWFSVGSDTRYYRYDLGDNDRIVHYGSRQRDYVTRVLDRRATQLVRHWSAGDRPFYLQLDERAPHTSIGTASSQCPKGPLPDPRDAGRYEDAALPDPPSFNEADVSDKPPLIRSLPLLLKADIELATQTYRCRMDSLRGVDRGVAAIHRALLATGSMSRTVIVFTSDNGYFMGEHRLAHGKIVPYEEAIHEPLAIRVPPRYLGGRTGTTSVSLPAANIDMAPTLLQLARAQPCSRSGLCRVMDGRSLVPLLRGHTPHWATDRSLLLEFSQSRFDPESAAGVCAYSGVLEPAHAYVHYTSAITGSSCQPIDESEMYDLHADPFELQNLFPASSGSPEEEDQVRLQSELAALKDCSGVSGRDPAPASGHYCS